MRILILDDDPGMAELMAEVVRKFGWDAMVTLHAAQFQLQFSSNGTDAIMLDLHLGGEDGIAQLRFLDNVRFRGPVILVSGFDKRVLEMARNLGQAAGLSI